VRLAIAGLLVVGAGALVVVAAPGSFAIAFPVMIVTFLLGAARLALDLIELDAVELAADVVLLVAVGVALVQIPVGNTALTAILFLVGAATQLLPRARAAVTRVPRRTT
jgi:hypothetical protein